MQPPPSQMLNTLPSFPSANITTEQIQKLLDDNKNLILAILENQNLGKLADCAQYQVILQKNLMYLAAIADAQPPATTMPAQTSLHSAVIQGNYMQHPQSAIAQQQSAIFGAKMPFQINNQQQQPPQNQLHFLQQQQPFQGQLSMRPGDNSGMYQAMQSGFGGSSSLVDAQGSRQDGSDAPSGRPRLK